MEKRATLNIAGTKINPASSQLLVSTGIPALDEKLGGGVPVGGIVLIEEDAQGSYAKVMMKYFLAEGIVNKHSSYIASLECDPQEDLFHSLPAQTNTDVEDVNNPMGNNKMSIAFRYQHLPTRDKQIKSSFGHYYDLSKCISKDLTATADVKFLKEVVNVDEDPYNELLMDIRSRIFDGDNVLLTGNLATKNVLRLGLHQLGTPLWGGSVANLKKFLYYLRALLRKSFSVAMITIPTHLSEELKAAFDERLVYISDIALGLQAFAGTKLERNKSLADYNGFFHFIKIAAINTLVSKHPGSVEFTFKLRKKKFSIETLHLPPDLGDDESNKKEAPQLGCGSSTKHLLEF
ncbi:PREDICTED: elongator complex protein 4 [Nicrophorus vespilloides]|uniref:Elongator complex protein 4 n=1 Tax=Nicrophorus vespilloides TaxID=110193 RepID=A0ABM1MDY9_NICVS|nr:PREDICTED: elongator complex protein 4 [Nicrophorus vespilloides]